MKRLAGILAVVAVLSSGVGPAVAFNFTFAPGDYDNDPPNTVTGTNAAPVYNNLQTTGSFRDVFWWGTAYNGGTVGVGSPDFINSGSNLVSNGGSPARAVVGGNDTALNFTGIRSTSAGMSLLTVYDQTPSSAAQIDTFSASQPGGLTLSADILFAPGQHATGGGVVALYSEGGNGLALTAFNGGGNNPDAASLSLIFQHNGLPTTVTTISLPGLTTFVGDTNGSNVNLGDHWYQIIMNLSVTGDTLTLTGLFYNHTNPEDPNSALGTLITTLMYSGSLSALNLNSFGEVGLMAFTTEPFGDFVGAGGTGANPLVDNMGISLTNFSNTPVPEPATMFLSGTGFVLLGYATRKRLFRR
jgi:hypothetical protein